MSSIRAMTEIVAGTNSGAGPRSCPAAHPGTDHGPVHTGIVMGVLRHMLQYMRIHGPCRARNTGQQEGSAMCRTRVIIQLSQRGRLDRRGILNSADDLLNLPLRQQSAFDVFLDHALLVDEHADRQAEHPVLVGHLILAVEQHRKRVCTAECVRAPWPRPPVH